MAVYAVQLLGNTDLRSPPRVSSKHCHAARAFSKAWVKAFKIAYWLRKFEQLMGCEFLWWGEFFV